MLGLEKLEGMSDSLKQYILLNYEIIKLEVIKKTSEKSASLFSILLVVIAICLFMFALTLGVGFYLSALIGDSYSGFMIVAGFYLLVCLVLLIGRKKLLGGPIRNIIIKELLDNNNDK